MLQYHTANLILYMSMSTYLALNCLAFVSVNQRTKRASQLAHYFLDIKSPVGNGRGFFCRRILFSIGDENVEGLIQCIDEQRFGGKMS